MPFRTGNVGPSGPGLAGSLALHGHDAAVLPLSVVLHLARHTGPHFVPGPRGDELKKKGNWFTQKLY